MENELHARVELDFSDAEIDWDQPVEIVDHGTFTGEWTLRDTASGIEASGESYLDARRKLSVLRRVKDRAEAAAERALDREARRLARDHTRVRRVA